jgi:hypothetical protein
MSMNAAVVDRYMPAEPTVTQRGDKPFAMIRRLAGRPRWSQDLRYLNIGDSYRISGGRRGHEGGSSWVHTHH